MYPLFTSALIKSRAANEIKSIETNVSLYQQRLLVLNVFLMPKTLAGLFENKQTPIFILHKIQITSSRPQKCNFFLLTRQELFEKALLINKNPYNSIIIYTHRLNNDCIVTVWKSATIQARTLTNRRYIFVTPSIIILKTSVLH